VNIIEAIKSGKKFKRVKDTCWFEHHEAQDLLKNIDYRALVADDWEVEEEKVTVTKRQLEAAWKKVIVFDSPIVRDLLAKELGL
jgi:spore coat polysaccharide biosynthesis predicted glycosyltransferase SpsG